jgi:hypothetical protein
MIQKHEIRAQEIYIVSLLQALCLSRSDSLITSHGLDFVYSVKGKSRKYCSIFVLPFHSCDKRLEIRAQEIFIVYLFLLLVSSDHVSESTSNAVKK